MRIGRSTLWLAIGALLVAGGCGHSSTTSNSAQSSNPNSATPPSAQNTADQTQQQPPPPPQPQPVVIRAGTVLSAAIDQALSSKTSSTGDHFDASLAEPIAVNGQEVLPVGTRMTGVITDSKSAGRFKGNARLGLALDSITVGDKTYEVQTSVVGQSSKGRGKRTGVGAGGGAAFGAIVGAIAGGGKGAALGALAGGGAGSAGAAFTGKRDIRIPAETRLDFRLTQPLTVPAPGS